MISANIQKCKIRLQVVNINSNNPFFYSYSIELNKCSGSCNNINDTYSKLCVPNAVKNINVEVFNLVSRTNETRHIEWNETGRCKYAGTKINVDVSVKN